MRSAQHKAAKARIWAERRCGELLKGMEKAKGGQPYQNSTSTPAAEVEKTIPDMGLTHKQSANWQQLADVPEEEFTDELAKLDGTKKTTVSASAILTVILPCVWV